MAVITSWHSAGIFCILRVFASNKNTYTQYYNAKQQIYIGVISPLIII